MNIVLQQYSSSCYNVWEDVCLNSKSVFSMDLAVYIGYMNITKVYTIDNEVAVAGVIKIYI